MGDCEKLLPPASSIEAQKSDFLTSQKIPPGKRALILNAKDKLKTLAGDLDFPEDIEVVLSEQAHILGGSARLERNVIEITEATLGLNDLAFEALIVHELTHFLVIKNFRSPGGSGATLDLVAKNQNWNSMIILMSHNSYAELICDVAAILLLRQPTIFKTLTMDLLALTPKTPASLPVIGQLEAELVTPLNHRDFSILPMDPRWADYQPKDWTYNRFNQIRSYLWNRWIKDLPPQRGPLFFGKLVQTLETVYRAGAFDRMLYATSVYDSNQALIKHLDSQLP